MEKIFYILLTVILFVSCSKDSKYGYDDSAQVVISDPRPITLTLDGKPLSNANVRVVALPADYYFKYLGNNWGETDSNGTKIELGGNPYKTDKNGVFIYSYIDRDKYIICVDKGSEYYSKELLSIPKSINFESKK